MCRAHVLNPSECCIISDGIPAGRFQSPQAGCQTLDGVRCRKDELQNGIFAAGHPDRIIAVCRNRNPREYVDQRIDRADRDTAFGTARCCEQQEPSVSDPDHPCGVM